jgi:hypothetical protein
MRIEPVSMESISKSIAHMEPDKALEAISSVIRELFRNLDDETKYSFMMGLIDKSGKDKISSMVHL